MMSNIVQNSKKIPSQESTFIIAAKQLNEANQQQLLAQLTPIIQAKNFWQSKVKPGQADLFTFTSVINQARIFAPQLKQAAPSNPVGITEIHKILTLSSKNIPLIQRLAMIYQIIDQRLNSHSNHRDPFTHSFYLCIQQLAKSPEPNQYLHEVLQQLEQINTVIEDFKAQHNLSPTLIQ